MVPKLEGALSHETLLCGKETATAIVATHCAQPMAACDPQPTTTQCTNLRFRGGDAGSWQQNQPQPKFIKLSSKHQNIKMSTSSCSHTNCAQPLAMSMFDDLFFDLE